MKESHQIETTVADDQKIKLIKRPVYDLSVFHAIPLGSCGVRLVRRRVSRGSDPN